jgi:hypothetical protein
MTVTEKNDTTMGNQPQPIMAADPDVKSATAADPSSVDSHGTPVQEYPEPEREKLTIGQTMVKELKTAGSALQIIIAALLAVAIGLIVSTQADNVPVEATDLVNIPGDLWLRALKAVGMSTSPT